MKVASVFNVFLSSGSAFQIGDLDALYPNETYDELTARRTANWEVLKGLVNNSKDSGNAVTLPSGQIEFFRPKNDSITGESGQRIKIVGRGEDRTVMMFYPFTLRNETTYTPLELEYGSNLQLQNLTLKCAQRQGKFETYDCVLKKGGNTKVIELTGNIRPGFWDDLQAGDSIYYTTGIGTIAETKTVASFDEVASTITLTADISSGFGSDTVAIAARHFDEDISEDDYNTYGDFWVWEDGSKIWTYGIFHQPAATSGTDAEITLTNVVIQNFGNGIGISSGNCKVTYENLEVSDCLIGFSFFARSEMNGQSITGNNLLVTRNGALCVGEISFLDNNGTIGVYGAGGYIHPTVIHTFNGLTKLLDNNANGWRMFSTSFEVVQDAESYFEKIIASSDETEYDFYASNCHHVTIDHIECDDLRIGGNITINGGKVRKRVISSVSLEPPNGTAVLWTFNYLEFYGSISSAYNTLTEVVHDIVFNDCGFYAQVVDVIDAMIDVHNETKSITLNNCYFYKDPSVGIADYTPGSAISGTIGSYLIYHAGKTITFNNLITDYMRAGLILQAPLENITPPRNERKIYLNDCEINLSKLFDANATTTDTFRTNMIEGVGTIVRAFNYSGLGFNLPLSFKPKIGQANVSILTSSQTYANRGGEAAPIASVSVAGVLEIDLEHNEYFVNTGTINRIALPTWNGVTKVSSEAAFTGEITIHAVGGDVVINPWHSTDNQYGNVSASITIPSGQSKKLVCVNKSVFAKSANSTVTPTIGTGDGSKTAFSGRLINTLVSPGNFTVTAGDVTGSADTDGNITGEGIDATSYIDYWTGTYYILFNEAVGNGVYVDLSYEKYNDWRTTGVFSEAITTDDGDVLVTDDGETLISF